MFSIYDIGQETEGQLVGFPIMQESQRVVAPKPIPVIADLESLFSF